MLVTLSEILPSLADLIAEDNIWVLIAVKLAIIGSCFLGGVSVLAMFAIWWERKAAGFIQGRVGPMHTGGWKGWAQSLADGIKLIQKEDLIPADADAFMFRLAPYLAFAPVFAAFVALPFGPQLCFDSTLSNGVLYVLAILAVEVMAVILAGWGSASKWSLYGAMREAMQLVSYEVPLGVSLLCGILVAGTLNMVELGYLQGGGIWDWFMFHNPFVFMAFFLYFVSSVAENKRAPFDLPEAESELVSGFHTEYSGLRFSFFFFAEYAAMFVVGIVQAFVFMGGWNSPFGASDPIYIMIGFDPITAGQAYFDGSINAAVGAEGVAHAMGGESFSVWSMIVLNAYGFFWVFLKGFAPICIQIWLRWTLPRIRIDQVMFACVKVLLPLSLILIAGTAVWVALVPQPQITAAALAATPTLADMPARFAHLFGENGTIQVITQAALVLVFLAMIGYCCAIVLGAFLTRDTHPRQSMFEDVMPVGNEIAFTKNDPPEAEESAADTEAEPA